MDENFAAKDDTRRGRMLESLVDPRGGAPRDEQGETYLVAVCRAR